MKTSFHFFNKSVGAVLLLGIAASLVSCSKEELTPTKELSTKTITSNNIINGEFAYNTGGTGVYSGNNGPVYCGASTSIAFFPGGVFTTDLIGHSELAPFCTLEFRNQNGDLALVVRHVGIRYGDNNNDGYARLSYTIPAQLTPGSYKLTLRTEDDNTSLVMGTTGTPSTYTHVLTDVNFVQFFRTNPSRQFFSTGITAQLHSMIDVYYYSYNIIYNTGNFANNAQMRAFAQNQSTGTLYQLTPGNDPIQSFDTWYGPNSVVGYYTFFTSTTGQQTITLNESGQPQFLPYGSYALFIDSFSNKYAGGDNLTIGQ